MKECNTVVIRNSKEGEITNFLLSSHEMSQKKFNCNEEGEPVNKKALDLLGIRYEC